MATLHSCRSRWASSCRSCYKFIKTSLYCTVKALISVQIRTYKGLADAETVQLQCDVPASEKFTVQLSAVRTTSTSFYSPVNFTD